MHRRSRMPRFRAAVIATVGVTVLAASACGTGDDEVDLADDATPATPQATPTPDPTPTPTPTSGSTDGAESDDDEEQTTTFDGDTEDVELEGAANQQTAVLDEVRIGRHDGYDRVVWEFSAGDRPRLWVQYVDEATEPGSGRTVDVAGEATIQMTASTATDYGAELYAPNQQPYEGPERVKAADADQVTEAVALGDFEATMEWAVGVDAVRPFRVEVLDDPLRVVLDVAH